MRLGLLSKYDLGNKETQEFCLQSKHFMARPPFQELFLDRITKLRTGKVVSREKMGKKRLSKERLLYL